MIGKTISHYKILEKLGEGGMGVVYKAHDLRLDRLVALKFLPQQIIVSVEDKARFLQEAKAASAVMHPNVCVIYDIAEHKGQQFIIMEFVDGKTLRQMVPVQKISDAIDYAIQIGGALQEAHSKGVVHRDVKTDNIMVNTRNQIKVMDFGLAKLKGSLKLTKTFGTVGTLSYMSPEQIQGAEVDARSDIFSFGVVLYEMLTGHLPFQGEYEAAMMYCIVNEEPQPVHKYRPEISSEVLHIFNRSLEKDPEERYQSVHDMVIDLKRVKKETAHAQLPVPPQPGIKQPAVPGERDKTGFISEKEIAPTKVYKINKKRLAILTAMVCFIVITAAIFIFKQFSKKQLPPMKIVPFASSPGMEIMPAFSPDGNQIAYALISNDYTKAAIFIKLIGAGNPFRLTESPGYYSNPVWSPDGRTIVFLRLSGKETGIYQIPALGGAEKRLMAIDSTNVLEGLDWSPDGQFVIYSDRDSAHATNGIYTLSLSDMKKHQITFPPVGTMGDLQPTFSPDGRWIAFLRLFSYATSDIFIIPFSGGAAKRITSDNLEIPNLAWSQDGDEIIFSSKRGGSSSLWRVPFKGGEPKTVAAGVENAVWVAVSRKERQLAFTKGSGKSSIYKADIPKKEGQIITTNILIATNQFNWMGQFSHNGRKIVFCSYDSGNPEIWVCNSDGSNTMRLTDFGGPLTGSPGWSADDQHIAFDSRPQGHADIYIMNADGGQLRRLTTDPADDANPTWSNDGRWIYFTSNRGGSYGIWKMTANGADAIQILKEEGRWPFESKDGTWLYYFFQYQGDLWKLSLHSGENQLVLHNIRGYIKDPGGDGIYYIKASSDGNDNDILYLSFISNSSKKIAKIKQKLITYLDISPDRHSLLFHDYQEGDFDIYLVENFR